MVFTELLTERQDALVLLYPIQQGRISDVLQDFAGISRLDHKVHRPDAGA